MALIRCPDCGHKVSDMAFACPVCARPVAAMEQSKVAGGHRGGGGGARIAAVRAAPSAEEPVPVAEPELPPGLEEFKDQLRAAKEAPPPAGSKACSRCGQDVRFDGFRVKSGAAYLCSECQDEDVVQTLGRRAWLRKWGGLALMVILAITVVVGALKGSAMLMQKPTTGGVKRN